MPGKRATWLFNSFGSKVVVFLVRFTVSVAQTYKIFNLSCTLFHAPKSTTNQGRIQPKRILVFSIFNNYSPKAKLILLNNPRDEVEGIIQQY